MALDRIVDLPRRSLRRRAADLITLGDHARDARQWERAAQLYWKALDRDPLNPPIWVQYGHALKESGGLRDPDKLAQAELAYRRALSLNPSIADSYLQLGHVLKIQGRTEEARRAYLRGFALDPSLDSASFELIQLGWSEAQLSELRIMTEPVDREAPQADPPSGSGAAVGLPDRMDGTSRMGGAQARVGELRSLIGSDGTDAPHPNPPNAVTQRSILLGGDKGWNRGAAEDFKIAADQLAPLFDLAFLERRYGLSFESVATAADAYFRASKQDRFDPSPHFSSELYFTLHPDVRTEGVDPLRHYLRAGRFESRCPHPLFNLPLVLKQCEGLSPENVYTSFLEGSLDVPFHELVDLGYVTAQCPELTSAVRIFQALCDPNKSLNFSPHPLFDPELYRLNAEVRKLKNELLDFLVQHNSCVVTSPLFDPAYYLQTEQPANLSIPPLLHFVQNWETLRGDVSPLVDVKFLKHQLDHLRGDPGSTPLADPLTFALTHHMNAPDALLHPHIDSRVIDIAFGNPFDAGSLHGGPVPEATRVAQLLKKFVMRGPVHLDSAPLVSIIILNFHKHVYTFLSTLAALNAFEYCDVEIVVVENGGELIHYEWLRRQFAKCGNVKFVKLKQNKYFGEGCNIGTDYATGSYILYLNNDCFLLPEYGRELRELLRSSPDAHAIGALLLFPSGEVQEFGGLVSDCGGVIQRAKGMDAEYVADQATPKKVDYASAACFVVSRRALASVAGFDPAFEPFFYEDTDLCRRLRRAGFDILVHPKLRATHVENATTRSSLGDEQFYSMISEHKELYARRWLKNKGDGVYARPWRPSQVAETRLSGGRAASRDGREVALVYTPFDIRPGGGERYLLSVARALSHNYRVILCSTEPFSGARVLHTLQSLDIAEFAFEISPSFEEIGALARDISLLFVMGNEIIPPVPPIGRVNLYHLQFPFPWRNTGTWRFETLTLYDSLVANSEFTRKWTLRRVAEVGVQDAPPVVVLNPPIRPIHMERNTEKPASDGIHLVTVGRFFTGGHSKRQDIFLEIVAAARKLCGVPITATIVGSVHPIDDARQFYMSVRRRANEMGGVEVLVDASRSELAAALARADVYVHCAGFGVVEDVYPEALEHFGISIVEALLAGCIPIVFDAGGPLEIIERSRCGFAYRSVDVAAQLICRLADPAERRQALATLDTAWLEGLLDPAFDQNVLEIVSEIRQRAENGRSSVTVSKNGGGVS